MAARARSDLASSDLPPFERVVETHGRALLRFCAAEAGPERADDCFQETMLAALGAYRELRDGAAVRSWLFAIAARKVIDVHRASVRAPQPDEHIEALATSEPDGRDTALWTRVGCLPDKQRRALTLRYCADLSHAEIAVVMGSSEAAARRNVFEALARLKSELAQGKPSSAGRAQRGRTFASAPHEAPPPAVQRTWQTRSKQRTPRSKRV